MKVLVICTGNGCRSQMAHGILQSFDSELTVCSAGTKPSGRVNAGAMKAMAEIGIDISHHTSDDVRDYLNQEWDYVITVCDNANQICPSFEGKTQNRLHMPFDDPAHAKGTPEFVESEFHRVRSEMKNEFYKFYIEKIKGGKVPTCSCGGNC